MSNEFIFTIVIEVVQFAIIAGMFLQKNKQTGEDVTKQSSEISTVFTKVNLLEKEMDGVKATMHNHSKLLQEFKSKQDTMIHDLHGVRNVQTAMCIGMDILLKDTGISIKDYINKE